MKYHKGLNVKKWESYPFLFRMANVGSEVIRAVNSKGINYNNALLAFYRSLELFDLTLDTKLTFPQYKEVCRLREIWVDYFLGDNIYGTDDKFLINYFNYITVRSRL